MPNKDVLVFVCHKYQFLTWSRWQRHNKYCELRRAINKQTKADSNLALLFPSGWEHYFADIQATPLTHDRYHTQLFDTILRPDFILLRRTILSLIISITLKISQSRKVFLLQPGFSVYTKNKFNIVQI